MDFCEGLLVLSCRLSRWWWRLISQGLILSLTLGLTFRGYKMSEIPTPYQVLYLPLELYAVVRAVSVIPMELTVLGVVSRGGV